ncbi:MAG: hypothetical protein E6Q97_02385 [Desulfurellales bacterium]|nr:MAG: hypothetical protein E6Q97_02385 [Desulfurellales bacterium]
MTFPEIHPITIDPRLVDELPDTPPSAFRLWVFLATHADAIGVVPIETAWVRAHPARVLRVSDDNVIADLTALIRSRLLHAFAVRNTTYAIVRFHAELSRGFRFGRHRYAVRSLNELSGIPAEFLPPVKTPRVRRKNGTTERPAKISAPGSSGDGELSHREGEV